MRLPAEGENEATSFGYIKIACSAEGVRRAHCHPPYFTLAPSERSTTPPHPAPSLFHLPWFPPPLPFPLFLL